MASGTSSARIDPPHVTLRLRLTLFYAAFFTIVVSFVATGVYVLTERSLTSALEERASQALADLSTGAILEGLRKLPGDAYYEVLILGNGDQPPDTLDQVRAGVPYIEPALFRPNPTNHSLVTLLTDTALDALVSDGELTTPAVLPGGARLQVLGRLGRLNFAGQGVTLTAAVFVGIPASNVTATLNDLARDLIITLAFAFALFAFGVYFLSSRVLRPLERVTQAAGRVTSQDLSQRVPVPRSDDEMRELAVTLNRMLDRLQESFETQRRFTADASHELRTPVTAIAGHANYLARRTDPTPEQRESLAVITSEAARMAKLVNDLLELARADAGFTLRMERMNLVEVLEAAREAVTPNDEGIHVTLHTPGPVLEVDGDPARLQQVVTNLIQNAINAGAHHVTLTLARDGSDVRLDVLDDGPGIPSQAVPHLFERFFRVDGARSGRGNGSGLGLPIVQWIVQQHGGSVRVDTHLGEGACFTVVLPTPSNGGDSTDPLDVP